MRKQLTIDGLLAIRPGMTYVQLEALVGPPLCVEQTGRPETCSAEVKDFPSELDKATATLSYAEPGASPFWDPSIYVGLTQGRVTSIYVKHDDTGICCKYDLPDGPFYGAGSRELLERLIGR